MNDSNSPQAEQKRNPMFLALAGIGAIAAVYFMLPGGDSSEGTPVEDQDPLIAAFDQLSPPQQSSDGAPKAQEADATARLSDPVPKRSYDEQLIEAYIGGKRDEITIETESGPVTFTPARDGTPPDWVLKQYPEMEERVAELRKAALEAEKAEAETDQPNGRNAVASREAALRDLMASGDPDATYELALLLREERNAYSESNAVLRKAAHRGSIKAMEALARFLEGGDRMARDLPEAYAWQTVIAALSGDERLAKRDLLVRRMSAAEAEAGHSQAKKILAAMSPAAIEVARMDAQSGQ